jgi:hypothetical protein
MAKKQTPVAAAVLSAAVTPAAAVVTPPVVAIVVDPQWREYGKLDAQDENAALSRVALYAAALLTADYATVDAFRLQYIAGATEAGFARPDDLISRRVWLPLKQAYNWTKPVSPTSTNARPKTPEQQAKIDAAKAVADKLAAMTEADCDAEIKAGKADPDRLAKLYARKVAAHKADSKAADKAKREENAKLYNACADILKTMEKAELQAAHRALGAIIAKRK